MTIVFKENSSWQYDASYGDYETANLTKIILDNNHSINLHHELTTYGFSDKYRYNTYIEVLDNNNSNITAKLANQLQLTLPIVGDSKNLLKIIATLTNNE